MRRSVKLILDHSGLTKDQADWLKRAEAKRRGDKRRLKEARALIR